MSTILGNPHSTETIETVVEVVDTTSELFLLDLQLRLDREPVDSDPRPTPGARLRAFRKFHGLTLGQAAMFCGLEPESIRRIEVGTERWFAADSRRGLRAVRLMRYIWEGVR